MQSNTYLIGFMGCGKTTVGGHLANYLGKKFQDLDEMITEEANMPIATIFQEYGESYFRTIETKVLYKTKKNNASIIATGGGIIERVENRDFLKKQKVIYLKWSFDTLYTRIEGDAKRPLATTKEVLYALYERRQKLYEEVATDSIVCDGHTPYSLAKYLSERMK